MNAGGKGMLGWLRGAVASLMLVFCHLPAMAAEARAIPEPDFEEFILGITPICNAMPAQHCIDRAWRFVDQNTDEHLSLDELAALQDAVRRWAAWRGESLPPRSRTGVLLGLTLVQSVGLERLIQSYDANKDQRLSRSELLSDITLDERPLGEILRDPKGLDREALAIRFGTVGILLNGVYDN